MVGVPGFMQFTGIICKPIKSEETLSLSLTVSISISSSGINNLISNVSFQTGLNPTQINVT